LQHREQHKTSLEQQSDRPVVATSANNIAVEQSRAVPVIIIVVAGRVAQKKKREIGKAGKRHRVSNHEINQTRQEKN
jgi:hypothetical protein